MSSRPQRQRKPTQTYVPEATEFVVEPPPRSRVSVDEGADDSESTSVSSVASGDEGNASSDDMSGGSGSSDDEQSGDESGSESESSSDDEDESAPPLEQPPPGSWKFRWSRNMGICWAQDKHGDWYEAKLVDVISKGDPRLENIKPEVLEAKRGLKAKAGRVAEFDVSENDWVRVHFQGWSPTHDEWVQFIRGGFICTKSLKECWCSRHLHGYRPKKPQSRSVASKSTTTRKKKPASPVKSTKSAKSSKPATPKPKQQSKVPSAKPAATTPASSKATPASNGAIHVVVHNHGTRSASKVQNGNHSGATDLTSISRAMDENGGASVRRSRRGTPIPQEPLKNEAAKSISKEEEELKAKEVEGSKISETGHVEGKTGSQEQGEGTTEESEVAGVDDKNEAEKGEAGEENENTTQTDEQEESLSSPVVSKSKKKPGHTPKPAYLLKEKVEVPPNRMLDLDEQGIPAAAKPILEYAKEHDMSIEKLLKTSDVGTYNTACRWWFKGEKLLRPAVVQGAAILLEWWDSMQEGRERQNVFVDIPRAIKYKQEMDAKLGIDQEQLDLLKKQQKRPGRLGSEVAAPPDSGVAPRRSSAGGEANPWQVRLLPATGRWETALSIVPGHPFQRIGLFDSQEEATQAARKAAYAVKNLARQMRESANLAPREERCQACGGRLLATEAPNAAQSCTYCPRKFHTSCVPPSDTLIVDNDAVQDWICPICEYEMLSASVRAGGTTSTAINYVRPTFAVDGVSTNASSGAVAIGGAPSSAAGAGAGATATGGASASSSSLAAVPTSIGRPRKPGSAHGKGRGSTIRFEEDLRYVPTRDGETEWIGMPYLTPPGRVAERRVFFSAFSRLDRPESTFRILDHVIISRRGSVLVEDLEEEQKNSPDFFVGQIEALWEERSTGDRFMRIAWFFWPEETDPATETFKHVGEGCELMTSMEVDVEPITRVIAKTRVLSKQEFDALQKQAKSDAAVVPPPSTENGGEEALLNDNSMMPSTTTTTTTTTTTNEESDDGQKQHELRECPRCGMWGFMDAMELNVHSQRFCGVDTPEALQNRRAEWGKPLAIGAEAPRPPTKDVELKPRELTTTATSPISNSKAAQRTSADTTIKEDETLNPLVVSRALARADKGPFFAHRHFNQRENRLDPMEGDISGENQFQSSMLNATYEKPQTSYWEARKVESKLTCAQDVHLTPLENPPQCGFCGVEFASTEVVCLCVHCDNFAICMRCFEKGRQGYSRLASDPTQFHRVTHSYKIRPARIDPANPLEAIQVLERVCKQRGLGEPRYELLEVSRSPYVPESPRRPRFRFGVHIAKVAAAICADEFGFTIEQAKAQAAFTVLKTYFGATHMLDSPLFKGWTCWEAAKLIDGIRLHGLAWETVAPIVGTKDATQCRLFFSEYLIPATTSSSASSSSSPTGTTSITTTTTTESEPSKEEEEPSKKRARVILAAGPDGKGVVDPNKDEKLPGPLEAQAQEDAIGWAQRCKAWKKRRDEGRIGTLFAVIEGSILRMDGVEGSIVTVTNPYVCTHCSKNLGTQSRIACVVCSDIYHTNCATAIDSAASSTAKEEWYCPACLEDEKFVYEHACWGASGRLLCAIADRVEGTGTQAVDAWDFSSKILSELNRKGYEIWFAEQKEAQEPGTVSTGKRELTQVRMPGAGAAAGGGGKGMGAKKRAKAPASDSSSKRAKKKATVETHTNVQQNNDAIALLISSLEDENRSLKTQLDAMTAERDKLAKKVSELTAIIEASGHPQNAENNNVA